MAHPILLYDGVCGLCHRLVQFVLRHDRDATFRFASLQSRLAAVVLSRHGISPQQLDTVYVVLNHNATEEVLLARSDAVLFVLSQIGGIGSIAARALRLFPRPLRDFAYNRIARNRYRVFGRYDSCPVPTTESRSRFLDI
jgi:predicted DCC family thiol-disulfide oxidoreductase YuxK